ncbi:MAG: OmpA family protein [Propioniciclava sp.]|nr:OmpA family protein [Propioniciclava sp.]
MRLRSMLLAALSALALLTGCTADGPRPIQLPGGGSLPGGGPAVEVRPERAPAGTEDDVSVRVDEVTRVGDDLAIALTLATSRQEARLYSHSVEATTNTGQRIRGTAGEDLRIPERSTAPATLHLPLPEGEVSSLSLQVGPRWPNVTVPVPAEDGSLVWAPAPLRQVGLEQRPVRNKDAELVLDAIRSEGMVTEVEVHGTGLTGRRIDLCRYGNRCTLVEADGTTHPFLEAPDPDSAPADARVRGTLRFLGELDPEATDLTLTLNSGAGGPLDPQRVTLPTHTDSPTVAAAGDLSRPAFEIEPVTLPHDGTGAEVTVTGLDVLSDHVQMHITAKGGERPLRLDRTPGSYEGSALIEPNGFRHTLQVPADSELTLRPGDALEASLVFQGSVGADITQLTLELGGRYTEGEALTTSFTIPATDGAAPEASGTLGGVETDPAAAPTPRATPDVPRPSAEPDATATPRATAGTLKVDDIQPLPHTMIAVVGPVRTAIAGVTPPGQTASADNVDAKAEAEAQRTLQDLGAQRTPDGWVLTLPETVLFDYNEADIKPAAATKLTEVAELLAYFDRARVAVQGHTDTDGSAEHNQDLSQRRAQAVADALAGQGVASSRMTVEGFGFDRPVASNADDAGKAKNRRVEIVLRENA